MKFFRPVLCSLALLFSVGCASSPDREDLDLLNPETLALAAQLLGYSTPRTAATLPPTTVELIAHEGATVIVVPEGATISAPEVAAAPKPADPPPVALSGPATLVAPPVPLPTVEAPEIPAMSLEDALKLIRQIRAAE